jgi:hypothetical protein
MSLFDWLGWTEGLSKPIDSIGKLYTTDKDKLEAQKNLEEVMQKRGLAQLENNKIMIGSANLFEALWPALIGWTSGACVALYYIPQLIIANIIWTMNCIEVHKVIPFPIDSGDILNLVYLLFGFGTYNLVKKKVIG